MCFRPLDGESISKLPEIVGGHTEGIIGSFRPLDGESISKRAIDDVEFLGVCIVSVP